MRPGRLIIKAREIEGMAWERRVHFLNPNADRLRKSLGDAVGMRHMGGHLDQVDPGRESTEYHKHYHEEECLYILSGRSRLTLGGETFPVAAGDFVGFPAADSPAHGLFDDGTEPLVYLVMGERREHDVADYPKRGKRLYRHSGQWDMVDMEALEDPHKGGPGR